MVTDPPLSPAPVSVVVVPAFSGPEQPTSPAAGEVSLEELAARLAAGEVLGLPTDTVYGMAADLAHPDAVARLAVLKGRPPDIPIAVLVADEESAGTVGHLVGPATDLARAHWPGPLTLVVPARPGVAEIVGSTTGTVGLRCPDHPLVRALARMVGPLATTSANRHGEPTGATAEQVARDVAGLTLVVDGGRLTGPASTVVEVAGGAARVLRAGPLQLDDAIL